LGRWAAHKTWKNTAQPPEVENFTAERKKGILSDAFLKY
jgi:hypothetical protein